MGKTMKAFYCTMIRGEGAARKVAWLLGPYATHDEALAEVPHAIRLAGEVDSWTSFDAFGTSSIDRPSAPDLAEFPAGRLSDRRMLENV